MTENCTNCRFSAPTVDASGAIALGGPRICRRYPPVGTTLPDPKTRQVRYDFIQPVLRGDRWCGEWQRATADDEARANATAPVEGRA